MTAAEATSGDARPVVVLARRPERESESGFTLLEMLVSIMILGGIAGAVGLVFTVSLQNAQRIQGRLPGPRAANNLSLFLASDITSATPVDPDSWLDTNPATQPKCAGVDLGNSVNVLTIETRSPTDPSSTYVASYRYTPSADSSGKGRLVRIFCRTGEQPSSNSIIAEGVSPTAVPVVKINQAGDSVEVAFSVVNRQTVYPVAVSAAIRTLRVAPSVTPKTTVPPNDKPSCAYTEATIGTGSISRSVDSPLDEPVRVEVITNSTARGDCVQLVAKVLGVDGSDCVLTRKGDSDYWYGDCFGNASFRASTASYVVILFDRKDPGAPKAEPPEGPVDVEIGGPEVGLSVQANIRPTAPTDVRAVVGNRSLVVSWTAPTLTPDTAAITGYTVTATPGPFGCTTTGTTICTLTGLTNQTTYTITVTATNSVGTGPASTPITGRPLAPFSITGFVFDDINYGGGAGRARAAATGGSARPNARVELYSVANTTATYLGVTTTDSTGSYTFTDPACAKCAVRVVVSTVTSGRTGAVSSLVPVPTYKTDGTGNALAAITNWVGGTDPAATDGGSGATGTMFDTVTGAFSVGTTGKAQWFALINEELGNVTDVSFGFNYDTLTNTNDSGPGSFRQVITNANALTGDGSLSVNGRARATEHVIFMLSNGTSAAGLRSTNNAFTSGIATITPTTALPAITGALIIDARTQPGWATSPIVELNGTNAGAGVNGITVNAGNSTIGGFVINRYAGSGILISRGDSNIVAGNYLGTNAAGTAAAANTRGVHIFNAGKVTVGGIATGAGNLISGNTTEGIYVWSGSPTFTQGNTIGLNAGGTAAIPNANGVVFMFHTGATIGGTTAAARNVISGNTGLGVKIISHGLHTVTGNYIGTNPTGTAAIPNGGGGVSITGPGVNTIGGTTTGAGNVISGNTGIGLALGAPSNTVTGNIIGFNAAGTTALRNTSHGIAVTAASNIIGGTSTASRNVIAGNAGTGVSITGSTATGNSVRGNAIYANTGIGIDLATTGVNVNDGTTTSAQPNILTDSPVFTNASLTATTLTVRGYVGSAASQSTFALNTVEVFLSDNDTSGNGEGQTYLGAVTANASGNFAGTITVPTGVTLSGTSKITGTATDANGNTSEFGPNRAISTTTVAIRGTVFEDRNYGGGAGRSYSASGGAGVTGATVELYDGNGTFVQSTTASAGAYAFTAIAADIYTVRVVDSTVSSTRTGATAGLLPVLTYRTNAATGTPVDVSDVVGGAVPGGTDPGAVSTGGSLSASAQSTSTVAVSTADVTGVDFGYNFDTVTNTNDSGAGSLRQVLTNANTLTGEASLNVSGRSTATEHIVFMIPNGTSAAGLRPAHNALVGGVAKITPVSATLPPIVNPLAMDATTQPGWSDIPIVQVDGTNFAATGGSFGIHISFSDVIVRGFSVTKWKQNNGLGSNVGIRIATSNKSGVVVAGNWVGITPAGVAAGNYQGIGVYGTGSVIGGTTAADRNIVAANSYAGVVVYGTGVTGNRVIGNYIGTDATGTSAMGNAIGVLINGGANAAVGGTASGEGNLISGNTGEGVYIADAGSAGTTIQGNYIGTNAAGTAALGNGGSAGVTITDAASGVTIGGTATGAGNLISGNPRGVSIASGSGSAVLRNRITGNAALGIDLIADGVTSNDGARTTGQPNLLMDSPVFAAAYVSGSNLVIGGYVGSSPSQATFVSSRVEVFVSDDDATGYGEGATFLGALTADANGNFTGSLPIPTGVTIAPGSTKITGTATDASNNTSEFGANFTVNRTITGTVFEDVNYGGGLGRSLGFSSGVPRSNALVELYTVDAGVATFAAAANTAADGTYVLSANCASCAVRVVGSSVTSSRTGSVNTLVAVPTFFTDASSGTVSARTDVVGGLAPSAADGGAATVGTTFSTTTGAFTSGTTGVAQTMTLVNVGSLSGLSGIDFGYSFDTVVNTNDSGAGSLRQVITNANTLGDDPLLLVSGRQGGVEHVIFMIPNGTSAAGLRSSLNAFTTNVGAYSVATITPGSGLPAVTSQLTLDAQTQPGWTLNPIIELSGVGAGSTSGMYLNASNIIMRGFIVNRFTGEGVTSTAGNNITIQGNWSGINAAGTAKATNTLSGIWMNSVGTGHTIGGTTPAQRNVLSGNVLDGLALLGGSGHSISGNYVGSDPTGVIALGNGGYGIYLRPGVATSTIGGPASGAGNVIAGNGSTGLYLKSVTGITVQGNTIGLNALGTAKLANVRGIEVTGGSGNTIGGTATGAGNVISGNGTSFVEDHAGISVNSAATGLTIAGNTIGLGSNRMTALGNIKNAIYIKGGSAVTVGGSTTASRNVIAGNGGHGTYVNNNAATGVTTQNNWYGVAADGTTLKGNGEDGVVCHGGTVDNCRVLNNVIAGSGRYGIWLQTGNGHVVKGNYIGTDANGASARPNLAGGLLVEATGTVTIGGTTTADRNLISGNAVFGLKIAAPGTITVEGNYIGSPASGAGTLANSGPGVLIEGSANETIGGTATGAGNRITGNTGGGVILTGSTATGNAILGNSITANTGLGIDLGGDGVTTNDGVAPSGQPNRTTDFPVIASAKALGAAVTVTGYVGSATGQTAFGGQRVEFFIADGDSTGNGEGLTYLGYLTSGADGTFNGAVSAPTGVTIYPGVTKITATATDSSNNTSEFGPNVTSSYAVTGAAMWVDASDTDGDGDAANEPAVGASVMTLVDKSGNGRNFTSQTGNQPTVVTSSFFARNALRFSGATQLMRQAYDFSTGPVTIIYVARTRVTPNARILQAMNNNWFLGWQGGMEGVAYYDGWVQATASAANTKPHVVSAVIRGTGQASDFVMDGVVKATNTGGVTGPNGLAINGAGYYNEPTDSELAEIVVFTRALTTAERSTIELGLMAKWGTSANASLTPKSTIVQSTGVGQAVPTPPQVQMTQLLGGVPIPGGTVTFTVSTGGSIGGGATATVMTDANGYAIAPAWVISTTSCSDRLTATASNSNDAVVFNATSGSCSAPYGVGGATMWVDASDTDGDGVSGNEPSLNASVQSLIDKTGNGRDFASQVGNQPSLITSTSFSKNVLRFTTSQWMRQTANFPAPATVIYVARSRTTSASRILQGAANNWLLGWWGGGEERAFFEGWVHQPTVAPTTKPRIMSAVIRGAGQPSEFAVDGVLRASSTGGTAGPNGLGVNGGGASSSEATDAEMAEILVFPRALTTNERWAVERGLATKWGLTNTESSLTATTTTSTSQTGTSGQAAVIAPSVQVSRFGAGVSGVVVTFTASGGSTVGGGATANVTTDSTGTATAPTWIAAATGCTSRLTASTPTATATVKFSVTPTSCSTAYGVSGASMWVDTSDVDADANTANEPAINASVQSLADRTGTNHDFTSQSGNQPTMINSSYFSRNVLRFNTTQWMKQADNFPAPATVIYVARARTTSVGRILTAVTNNWLLGWHGGLEERAYFEGWVNASTVTSQQRPRVMSAVIRGPGQVSDFAVDGVVKASNTGGVTGPNGLTINAWGEATESEFAELLVFPRALPASERSAVEAALTAKWLGTKPNSMTAKTAVTQTGAAGQAAPIAPSVQVLGFGSAPASGVSVTFTAMTGSTVGGSLTADVVTDSNGNATAPAWVLGAAACWERLVVTSGTSADIVRFTASKGTCPGPYNVAAPSMWVDASDVDGDGSASGEPSLNATVLSLIDKSGNFRDFESALGFEPTLTTSTAFAKIVLRFTPGQWMKQNHNFGGPSTVIYVARARTTTGVNRIMQAVLSNFLLGWYGGVEERFHPDGWVKVNGVAPTTRARIMSAVIRGSGQNSDFAVDGVVQASNNGGSTGPNGISINTGAAPNDTTDSEVAEIITFPRALTNSERVAVETGLAAKWGVTLAPDLTALTTLTPTGTLGQAVPSAPQVRVARPDGTNLSGVTVTFAATKGGGTVGGLTTKTAVTDANGIATSPSWVLGASGFQELTVTTSGVTLPVVFMADTGDCPYGVCVIPSMWVDASDSDADGNVANEPAVGSSILKLTDKSGNARHFASSSVYQPTLITSTSFAKNVLRFTPGQWMRQDYNFAQPSTVIYVGRARTTTTQRVLTSSNNGSWLLGWFGSNREGAAYYNGWVNLPNTNTVTQKPRIMSSVISGIGNSDFLMDGTVLASNTLGMYGPNGLGINTYNTEVTDAEIAEIIVFPRGLTSAERARVESALALKWGITIPNPVTS